MADAWRRGRAADDLLGATLGNCQIEALIGEGGMARVYRARQPHLDRDVAIKVLPAHYAVDPAFVERFEQEARAMARLSHPNIVTVHDSGEDAGHLYIIMEYVDGPNLREVILGGLTLEETAHIVTQIGSALTFAHEHGIVHRDVKPANVLLDATSRARLSDFGIAKVFASNRQTQTGAGVGTPEYMSPEQCKGGLVDARSDIYALGAMLYEMLTGRPPFVADNYTAIAHSQIYERPIPPSKINPRISPAVQAVVLKALEKVPGDRFQQATDMADTLELAVASQMPVGRPSGSPGMARSTGRVAATVVCPRCSAANSAQQRFCSNCGLPFAAGRSSGGAAAVPTIAPSGGLGCPHCAYANQPLNHFCTQCGTPLVAAMVECRDCGAPNAPSVRFCTACGHPLG